MNTTLHLIFSYSAYHRRPAIQATVLNHIQAFFNSFLGLFSPADDPAALRYMSARHNGAID